MKKDNLNPNLMIGDEVTVVHVDKSYGTMNTAERFKDYVVTGIKHRQPENWESPMVDTRYYEITPIGETQEQRLGRMLAGGGMVRRERLYPTDSWVLRKGFRRGELEEEPNEIARTLSKARKHGVGTRFPKAAIKANPQRFRKYTRDKYLKEQQEINPELEAGDKILIVSKSQAPPGMREPFPEQEPELFLPYTVIDKMYTGPKAKDPYYYFLLPNEQFETYLDDPHDSSLNKSVKALFPWIHDWIMQKNKINEQTELSPALEKGDIIRVIDVDGEHGKMPERFAIYVVQAKGDKLPDGEWYLLHPMDHMNPPNRFLDVAYMYRGDTWVKMGKNIFDEIEKLISEQVNPEDYGIVDGEKRDAEAVKSNTPGAPDRTPFTKLEVTILKQLHKNLDRSELQAVVEETPGDWGSGKKFWNVMKIFGINYTRDMVEDTRVTKYAKWALDNWTEDGDYASIERPIKEKLKWFEIDREETGSQVEYKDGSAEVLGFDEDDAGTRADYDFYSWGGEMETSDYGDYETYDSEITRSDFIRVDEGLTPKMVEELKGPKEIQELLFNFWKKHGPTLDPDRLKLIGFNMNDADDRTKVTFNLVEYYGDEELINIITDRLEGIQGWEYEYVVTSIDFHDLLNFNSYPFTIMVDVIVDGSTEVPVSTEDGIEDMTLWETNERAQKEWKGGGPGPYDNVYEEVREQVLSDVSILLKNLPVEPMLDYVDFSEPNDSIDNYVGTPEIMTESKLDKLVWKEKPLKKHEKRMEKDFGVFEGFPIKDFMNKKPPKNSSEESMDELMLLDSLPVIEDFVKTTDDIFDHFKPYFKKNKLELPEKELKDILKNTSPIILKLKYHYNRPRPQQLANEKGLDFHQQPLESSRTPSYPSGHSTQGRLIAKILSDKFPKHESEINKLGNEIGTGRLVAKVHYPSDDLFGKELGDALYKFIKDKEILKEENDIVIKDDNHPYDHEDYNKFIDYVVGELNIENPPTVYVEKEASSDYTGGTYRYKGGPERIKVRSKGRSLMDILRSIAHELVHHKQKEDGMFEDKEVIKDIPEVGGPIEDEANAIAGRLIKKYGKENKHLYEQMMVKKGDMLKSDVFKFLSNRFALTPTEFGTTEIKDVEGNYYRIIDIENPYESVNLSDLLEPAIEMVSYGIKSGVFEDGDIQKAIEAVTDWLSLSMNQEIDLIN